MILLQQANFQQVNNYFIKVILGDSSINIQYFSVMVEINFFKNLHPGISLLLWFFHN
jgi:hypothetical protein